MARPSFIKNTKKKICLICEGFEEYDYIKRLLELGVWADVYSFDLVNAESNGNISARYQNKYQSDEYDIVLVLCDTDRKPHKDFKLIKQKIDDIFGVENASDEVIIFVAPCTGIFERAKKLSDNFEDVPSSNFYKFVSYFENFDCSWIGEINKRIEE